MDYSERKSTENYMSLLSTGRCLIGLGILGIGLIHFVVPGFRPDILPMRPDAVSQIFPYLAAVTFTVAGMAILIDKKTKTVSLSLGLLLLLVLVFGHLPIQLRAHPERLVYWTPTLKLMALAGGLLLLSTVSVGQSPVWLDRIAYYGKYLFAFHLVVFGIGHILNAEIIENMVPGWIPARLFWAYATGIALIGSGLSIFINFRVRVISLLLAAMLLSWLVMLHFPGILGNPFADGSLAISSCDSLADIGTALLLAEIAKCTSDLRKS